MRSKKGIDIQLRIFKESLEIQREKARDLHQEIQQCKEKIELLRWVLEEKKKHE